MKSSTATPKLPQATLPLRKAYATPTLAPPARVELITITRTELEQLLADVVHRTVAELLEGARQPAAVLTTEQCAEALQVSRPTLMRLRADGCPSIPVGEHYRWELSAVLGWLRARREGPNDAR